MKIHWRNIVLGLLATFAVALASSPLPAHADDISGGMFLRVATSGPSCTPSPCIMLQWTAPTLNTNGTPITGTLSYNLYGGVQGVTPTLLATGITGQTTTRTNVQFGTTYCYTMTAVETFGTVSSESDPTNQACAAPLPPVPNAPGNLQVSPTTTTTTVYDDVKDPDHKVVLPVGRIPLGTPCIATEALVAQGVTYYAVPRASVTFSASVQPPIVYGLCS